MTPQQQKEADAQSTVTTSAMPFPELNQHEMVDPRSEEDDPLRGEPLARIRWLLESSLRGTEGKRALLGSTEPFIGCCWHLSASASVLEGPRTFLPRP